MRSSSAAVQACFPFSRPAALFSKDGGQVDPHRLTHGLLAAGKRAGLEVYDRTRMSFLAEIRRGVRITTHNGCQITARRAVIAAGFESKALLNVETGILKSTYALISEPLPEISGWHQQCLIWESGSPYLYLRTTTEGRVIVGGEDEDFVNAKRREWHHLQRHSCRGHPGLFYQPNKSRCPPFSLRSLMGDSFQSILIICHP